jgi:uncharacterized protein (TIGR02186 family)
MRRASDDDDMATMELPHGSPSSPACGGGSGRGQGHKHGASGRAPSLALPRKRRLSCGASARWVIAICFAALLLLAFSAPPARAERLIASLSSHVVQITSNFTGVELTLFGTVENDQAAPPPGGGYDIVVTVTGPRQSAVARQKERIFGIWINAASRTFIDAPSYLAVLSTRPFESIASPDTLHRELVGIANVPMEQKIGPDISDAVPNDPFRQAFVRLKHERNLYGEITDGVTFRTPSLYRAAIYVPAEAVIGNYDVDVKLFAGGAMIARTNAAFEIMTVGFERFIANAAVNHGLGYGLATTVMAVVTGWMASILFRRD